MSSEPPVDGPAGPGPTANQPAGSPEPEPTCPRHPGTVSYVRCQRCSRPTCPPCQRVAAVGVHCVDCVSQAAAETPRQVDGAGFPMTVGKPIVTYVLIAACAVVWLLQMAVPGLTESFALTVQLTPEQPYRIFTSGFLHSQGSPLHLLLNMVMLYQLGSVLEPRCGRLGFLAVYLLCMWGGSLAFLFLSPGLVPNGRGGFYQSSAVGASGAIFGLFALYIVLLFILKLPIGGNLMILAINMVLGFVLANIAWQAHLGGLVVGGALGGVVAASAIPARAARFRTAIWVSALVLAALSVIVLMNIPGPQFTPKPWG